MKLKFTEMPRASSHVHLEGTCTPALGRLLAKKNGKNFPEDLVIKDSDQWYFADQDFMAFLQCYDRVTHLLVMEDMETVTYEYLKHCHEQNVIYVELTVSPDHFLEGRKDFIEANASDQNAVDLAALARIYANLITVVSQGIFRAKSDFGIDARIRIALLRHEPTRCMPIVQAVLANPHPFVVGFDLVGDEKKYPAELFQKEYAYIRQYNETAQNKYGLSAHAGEHDGPETIQHAINLLGLQRVGHCTQSMHYKHSDPAKHQIMVKFLQDNNIGIESCPGSNIALKVCANYLAHPLKDMIEEKLCVSLGDDDPTFAGFKSIASEYQNVQAAYQLDDAAMLAFTVNAIRSGFCETLLKEKLLLQVECYKHPARYDELQIQISTLDQQITQDIKKRLLDFVESPADEERNYCKM